MVFKYKAGLIVFLTLALSLALAPAALASTQIETDFGLTYGTATKLGNQDLRETIATIINVALSLLGIVALVGIVYGGFKMMTAGGNEDQSGEGKKAIIAGVVGLAIILSAYAIANFVLNQLGQATGYGT